MPTTPRTRSVPPEDLITVHIPERDDCPGDTYTAPGPTVDSVLRRFGRRTIDELREHIADVTGDMLLENVKRKTSLLIIIAALEYEAALAEAHAALPLRVGLAGAAAATRALGDDSSGS